jgi:putative FmdB family regulatory protein
MPTYEYRCAKCGEQFDVYQSFSDEPLTKHKGCGGKVSKVLGAAGIVLKGSGFYKTDNRSKAGGSSKEKSESASSSDSSGSSSSSTSSDSSSSSSSNSSSSSSEAKSA